MCAPLLIMYVLLNDSLTSIQLTICPYGQKLSIQQSDNLKNSRLEDPSAVTVRQ